MELSNKEVKKILSQNHITDKDIKGHGKNGRVLKSDRMKTYLRLQKKLKSRKLILPPEVVKQITSQVPIETRRLINKEHKREILNNAILPTLPNEVINIITKDVKLPTARLINKQYLKENAALHDLKSREKILKFVLRSGDNFVKINNNMIDYGYGGYEDVDELINDQWTIISKLTNDEMVFYNTLIKMLKQKRIMNTDDDYFNYNVSHSFVFVNDKIIFVEL